MSTPKFSITIVTAGMVVYTLLCHANLNIPTWFLIAFLVVLEAGLIWMVLCILKRGKPSQYTFDQRMYDDVDFNEKR